jgi:hypothetical protein
MVEFGLTTRLPELGSPWPTSVLPPESAGRATSTDAEGAVVTSRSGSKLAKADLQKEQEGACDASTILSEKLK